MSSAAQNCNFAQLLTRQIEVEKHPGRLRIIEASSPPATAPLTPLPDEDANATNDVALHSDL